MKNLRNIRQRTLKGLCEPSKGFKLFLVDFFLSKIDESTCVFITRKKSLQKHCQARPGITLIKRNAVNILGGVVETAAVFLVLLGAIQSD